MATGGVGDLERGTDETFDFMCSVCNGKDKISEAELFCSDCHDYYCNICVKFHEDIPALKKHRILNKAQFQPGSGDTFPTVPTEQCKVHGHKPVDMFCAVHDVVGCSTCMVVQHSFCSKKFYIPEYVKDNCSNVNTEEITHQLDSAINKLVDLEKYCIKQIQQLANSKKEALNEIGKLRKAINTRLDEFEKITVQEMEQKIQSLSDKIESSLTRIQASTKQIKCVQETLKSAGGNISQQFVSIKTASVTVFHANETIDKTKSQCPSTEISFETDRKLQSLWSEIKSLGHVIMNENQMSKPETCNRIPLLHDKKTQSEVKCADYQFQIKRTKKYTVKVQADSTTCSIFSACTLGDGTIILADHDNRRLKRLDNVSYSVKDYCDVNGWLWQVCAISNQEVAVCLGITEKIQFVSIGSTMQATRQISTKFCCHGLSYADGKLFVSGPKSLYLYTTSGDRLQELTKDDHTKNLFSNIYSLALGENSKIYVADFERGLIILDAKCHFEGQFNGPQVKGATGLCLIKNDSVLVCGRNSRNIVQISHNEKLITVTADLKTDKPCSAICYDKDNMKLCVGSKSSNEIEVYDLK